MSIDNAHALGRPRHSVLAFYVVRTACQWRNLLSDFAPWRTVYHYLRLWTMKLWRCTIEIVKRSDAHTFKVLPRRWVVERTFGWMGRYRRLNRD